MTLIRTSPSGPNVEVDAPVDLGPHTVYGNPTGAPAVGVDIPLGINTVLGRVAGNVVAAQLVTAQIALNQVTNAVLAQGAALTVKANPTGALADFQDVPATADDTVFRRVGGVLDFGPLTPGMIPSGIFPLSSIEPLAANTVVANATAGVASPTAVAVGTNTVLGRVAGNIVAAQVVSSQIGAGEVANSNLALMDANTVKVNATGAPASPQDLTVGMNAVVGRVGGSIIAAQLVTAQIALNQVDNTILAKMAANTVKANATGLLADPQDVAVGTNTVLGRVAGNIVAAQLVTAQIAVNQVTNAVLAQMAALTVKANPTGALANAQDVAATSNDTVFRRVAGALDFGPLTPGMIPAAIIPLSAIEQLAANTVVANATAGLASPTAVPVGFNTVLGRVAGNIVAAQLVTAQIAVNQVTNAVLAQMAANTVKANATAALADPQDLSVGTNTVLGRVAGNIVAAQLVTAQIAVNQVTNAVLAQMAANTVKVNATAALADPQDLAVGTNTVLGRVAGNIVAAQLVTAQIAVNQVTNAVLAQMAALTVKANATNGLANAADLAASSDDTVLRRTSSTLSFGQLTAGMFPAAIIPLSSLATQAANTVVANATAGVASPTAVAIGTNTVLGRVAGNIVAAQLVTAQIAVNQVTNAVLAQMAANTVKANATAALADPQDVSIGTNSVLGRVAGNIVAAQVVTAQIAVNQVTNAVLAQMAANTVKANATAALADPQDLSVGTNTVLGRVAGNIVAAQLVTGQIADANVTLPKLATQATDTLVANVTAGTASPTAATFTSLVSATTSLAWDATNHRFAYIGSTSSVSATPSGAVGVLNIASLESGGQVLLSPTANANIDGFTAKAAGFWFDLIYTTTTTFTVTLNNAVGGATAIQCAGNVSTSFSTRAMLRLRYNGSNWVVGAADSWSASLAIDSHSGAFNPVIDAGQFLAFGSSLPASGDIRAGNLDMSMAGDFSVTATGGFSMSANTDSIFESVTGSISFLSATSMEFSAVGSVGLLSATDEVDIVGATFVVISPFLKLFEQAASTPVLSAGQALVWVRNDTPNVLVYTDDTNTDFRVALVPVPNADLASMAANTVKANATAGATTPTDVAIGTNSVLGRVAGNIVAAQLVTAQIAVNQVTNAVLAQMAANTVKVNATAALADPQDVAIGTNTVLGRVAGNIVAAQVVNAQVTGGALGTVKGVAVTGVAGTLADLTGLNVGGLIRFANEQADTTSSGTVTTFSLTNQSINALTFNGNTVTLHSIVAPTTPGTLLVLKHIGAGTLTLVQDSTSALAAVDRFNFGNFSQNSTPLVLGTGQGQESILLIYFGSRWQWVENSLAAGTIPVTALAAIAANTFIANATAGSAVPTAVAVGTNTVVGRVAGNIVAAQLVNAQMVGGALSTVKGVAFNGVAGTLADLTGTQIGQFIRYQNVSDTTTTGSVASYPLTSNTGCLTFNAVTNQLEGMVAPTVTGQRVIIQHIGTGTTTIVHESSSAGAATERFRIGDIPANTAAIVLDGTTPGQTAEFYYDGSRWTWVNAAVANGFIINASFANMAANTVKANATAGSTTPTDFAIGTNSVLGRVAGNIVAAQLVTAQIAVNQITNALLAQMAANTVKANATAALADPQDLAVGTNTVVGRVAGNIVAAQVVTGQITDANVTYAKIQNVGALSILARVVNSSGVVSELHSPGSFAVPYDDGAGNLTFALLVTGNYGNGTVTLPKLATQAANTVVANDTAGVASPTAVAIGTNTVLGRVAGNIVAAALVPQQLAVEASSIAVTFSIRVLLTATGAAADDVIIYNANAPFAFRILRAFPVVTVGQPAGTLVGRNATGGGGSTVTSTFSATAASDAPTITVNNGVSLTIAASGTLVIRRSSGNIEGEFTLLCCKS